MLKIMIIIYKFKYILLYYMNEKYNELLKYSDMKKVLINAKRYLGKDVLINVSTRKDKKFMVYDPDNDKWIHFGSFNPPMEDYTKHQNETRKLNYLLRSNNIKSNWKKNPYSPNNLAINILWQ